MIDKTMDILRIKQTALLNKQRNPTSEHSLEDAILLAAKLGKERGLTAVEFLNEALDWMGDTLNTDLK